MKQYLRVFLLLSTCLQGFANIKEVSVPMINSYTGKDSLAIFVKVIDSVSGKPIFAANIIVSNAKTGDRIDGYLSNTGGEVTIHGLKQETEYIYTISHIGYKTISEKLNTLKRAHVFNLTPQVQGLDEIVIKTRKEFYEFDGDKVVYDVERDPHSTNGSTLDIMRKVPFVTAGPDDNISINGSRKVQILINGKRRNMGGGNSVDILRFLQPAEISKIEVYTNPGVKYDSEESSVINIITRKKNIEGWRADINGGIGNRGANSNSFVQISKKKFSLTGSLLGSWIYNKTEGGITISDLLGKTYIENTSVGNLNASNYSSNLNLDINISPKITAYLGLNNKKRNVNSSRNAHYKYGDDISMSTFLEAANIGRNRNVSAEVVHQFKKIENQISVFFQNGKSINDNTFEIGHQETVFVKNRGESNENTFQVDWQNAPTRKTFIEAGVRSINRNMGTAEHEGNLSAPFRQRQSIFAGYSSYSFEFKNKVKVVTGVRYENMLQSSENGNKNYSNVFPNIQFSKKLPNQRNLKASYSQRIVRPSIVFLNPNSSYSDQVNIWKGNPDLVPEKIHNWELSFSKTIKRGTLLLNSYFRSSNNPISIFDTYVPDEGVVRTNILNLDRESTIGTNNFVSIKINNRLHSSVNGNIGYKWIYGGEVVENRKNSGVFYNISFLTSYEMNKKTLIQFLGGINSESIHLQGVMPGFQYMNLGIRRNFKDNRGYYSIGVDNPFSKRVMLWSKAETVDASIVSHTALYGQGIRLMVNYKIGKGSNKAVRKRNNRDFSDLKESEGNI